MEGIC